MTDQTKAVAALAEAMEPLYTDPVLVYTIQGHARRALQAIQAQPDILREYGIGRLPTRSELESIWDDDAFVGVRISEMIRLGWAIEDPDPQPPEPTLREQVARMLYSAENPTFKWDSVPSQWHHRRMFDMADTIIGNFDITLKAPRP